MLKLQELMQTLIKRTNEGIDKLGADETDIGSETYGRILNNVVANINILNNMGYVPKREETEENGTSN